MALFDTLHVSGSGLYAHRKWLDAVSDNIANVNTVRGTDEDAFQARYVRVQANEYGGAQGGRGVRVAGAEFGDPQGRLVYQPDHPLADEEGYVKYPDIDLGDQMTMLIVAQRAYQANLAVIERARDAYQQAITIGR